MEIAGPGDQPAEKMAVVFQSPGYQVQHLAFTLYFSFDCQQARL